MLPTPTLRIASHLSGPDSARFSTPGMQDRRFSGSISSAQTCSGGAGKTYAPSTFMAASIVQERRGRPGAALVTWAVGPAARRRRGQGGEGDGAWRKSLGRVVEG